jgi:hypothetical protein
VLNIVPLAPVVQELAAEIHLLGRTDVVAAGAAESAAATTVVNR